MTGYFIFHLLLLESKISEFSNPMLEVINNNGINKFDGTNLRKIASAGGCCRPLSESSGARFSSFGRREEPDSSTGSNAARPSVEEGALRNNDPRLQA